MMAQKHKAQLIFIYGVIPLALLALFLYLIQKPDFLFWWDERFHALVAKNLVNYPWIGQLYPLEVFEKAGESGAWYNSNIWLHKPPLFSYIEALFMKVFGVGLFQFRLASALSMLLLYFSFLRIQILMDLEKWTASFIAAGLCLNPFLLKLMMGWQGMDHNDLAFITCISLAIWMILAYRQKKSTGRLILISLFTAAAVLTKWLAGFLPFLFWFLADLKKGRIQGLATKLKTLGLSLILIAPWYIYTFWVYPSEAKAAFVFNQEHFAQVVENHQQPWYFHFQQWGSHFFLLLALILLTLILNKASKKARPQFWAAAFSVGFVLIFFSLAQTKLPAFSFIALPLVLILLSSLSPKKPFWRYISLGFLLLAFAQMAYIPFVNFADRYPENHSRAQFYRGLKGRLSPDAILIGAREFSNIEAQFYCDYLVLNRSTPTAFLQKMEASQRPIYQIIYNEQGREKELRPLPL